MDNDTLSAGGYRQCESDLETMQEANAKSTSNPDALLVLSFMTDAAFEHLCP